MEYHQFPVVASFSSFYDIRLPALSSKILFFAIIFEFPSEIATLENLKLEVLQRVMKCS